MPCKICCDHGLPDPEPLSRHEYSRKYTLAKLAHRISPDKIPYFLAASAQQFDWVINRFEDYLQAALDPERVIVPMDSDYDLIKQALSNRTGMGVAGHEINHIPFVSVDFSNGKTLRDPPKTRGQLYAEIESLKAQLAATTERLTKATAVEFTPDPTSFVEPFTVEQTAPFKIPSDEEIERRLAEIRDISGTLVSRPGSEERANEIFQKIRDAREPKVRAYLTLIDAAKKANAAV